MKRDWQIGLIDVLLMLGLVGALVCGINNHRRASIARADLKKLHELVGRLDPLVEPDRIQVARVPPLRYDENAWRVRLPDGSDWSLKIATREIGDAGQPPARESATLAVGDHEIALRVFEKARAEDAAVKDSTFVVLLDGVEAMRLTESADWDYSGSARSTTTSERAYPADLPLTLFRQKQQRKLATGATAPPNANQEPGNGVLLWLERQ